jgi:hypothetical protein
VRRRVRRAHALAPADSDAREVAYLATKLGRLPLRQILAPGDACDRLLERRRPVECDEDGCRLHRELPLLARPLVEDERRRRDRAGAVELLVEPHVLDEPEPSVENGIAVARKRLECAEHVLYLVARVLGSVLVG